MATRFRVFGVSDIFVDESGGGGNVPAPPAYPADLVSRGGVLMWRQHETVDVDFVATDHNTITWTDFVARPFSAIVSSINNGVPAGAIVSVEIINITSTGCTVQLSGVFTGRVSIDLLEQL